MSTHAEAIATVASWDENPYDEAEGTPRKTKASITYSYDGDITGEGAAELLMVYVGQEAEYVGLERVTGRLEGRSGTFVVSCVGGFKEGVASSTWNVVAGSATGELEGLRGTGTFEAPAGNKATVTFDYEIA